MSVTCDARDAEGLFVTVRSRGLRSFGDISLDLLLIVKNKQTKKVHSDNALLDLMMLKLSCLAPRSAFLIDPNQDLYEINQVFLMNLARCC